MSRWTPWRAVTAALRADSPGLIAVARLIAAGLALAGAPLIARGIGPDGRGETSAAMAGFYLVPIILGLGVPTEARRLSAISDVGPVVRAIHRYCLMLIAPSILVGVILVSTVFSTLSQQVQFVTMVGLALSPAYVSVLASESVLIATGRIRHVFALIVIPPTVVFTWTVLLFLAREMTAALVLLGAVAGAACAGVYGLMVTRHHLRGLAAVRPKLLSGSLKFAGSAMAEAASNRLDQLLAVAVIGAHEAGLYAIAVTVSVLPLPLAHSFSASTFTQVARLDGASRHEVEAESIRVTAIACFAVSAALAIASPALVPLIFGRDFSPAVTPTLVSLLGGWLACVAYVASMVLAAEGRGISLTTIQTGGLGIGLCLFLILGPPWGALGAAVASSASSAVLIVALLARLRLDAASLAPRMHDLLQAVELLRKAGKT